MPEVRNIFWIGIFAIGILSATLFPTFYPEIQSFVSGYYGSIPLSSNEAKPSTDKIFTPSELEQYKGSNGRPIYLSILGDVYDVSATKRLYGPDGDYYFFSGRDSTISFLTGTAFDGTQEDIKKKLSVLTDSENSQLKSWIKFYENHEIYKRMGVVSGLFYKHNGQSTSYRIQLLRSISDRPSQVQPTTQKVDNPNSMPEKCQLHWKQDVGGHVQCENNGYPRKHISDVCYCVSTEDMKDQESYEIYPGCSEQDTKCTLPP